MATEKESLCQSYCTNDPNFAIICSFFDRFSASCGISHPTFSDLQEMIENSQEVSPELIELHVKLLRKIRKSVSAEKWERALIKFCHSYYISEDGWELERCGYSKCKIPSRLRILKTLLDAQFDLNSKFKADINKLTAEELRVEPLGKDKVGQSYWCQFDPSANVRVYKEDQDEETWKLVAKDREDLVDLINQLSSGEELLGLELINEDSNSLEVEKPITDTGQVEMTSEENSRDNTSITNVNIENCNGQDNSSNDASVSQVSSTVQENNESLEEKINKLQGKQITFIKKEIELTNVDTSKVSHESNPFEINNTPVDEKDTKIMIQPEGGKTELAAVTDNFKGNDIKQIPNSQSINLDPTDVPKDLVSLPAQTVSNSKIDCSLPSQITEDTNTPEIITNPSGPTTDLSETTTNPSETCKLNVAEEIKQRSLTKSCVNQSSFKGKNNKPTTGSKLDLIFSRKLEQSTSGFSTDNNSKSFPKTFNSLTEKEDISVEDDKPISKESIDLSPQLNEFAQVSSASIESSCSESNSKRKPDEPLEQPTKKQCLDVEHNEVGEEIEEPVMIIKGEGSGQDCDTGNPGRNSGENVTTKESISTKSCSSEAVNNQEDITSCSEGVSRLDSCSDNSQKVQRKSEINTSSTDNASSEFDKSIEEQLSAITGESLSPKQNENEENTLESHKKSNSSIVNTDDNNEEQKSPCTDKNLDKTKSHKSKETQIMNDTTDIFGTEESSNQPIVKNEKNDESKKDFTQLNNIQNLLKTDVNKDQSTKEIRSVSDKTTVDLEGKSDFKQKTDQNKETTLCQIGNKKDLSDPHSKHCHVTSNAQVEPSSIDFCSGDKTINNCKDMSESLNIKNITSTKVLCKSILENDAKNIESTISLNSNMDSVSNLLLHEDNKETANKTSEKTIFELSNAKELSPQTHNKHLDDHSKDISKSQDNNIDLAEEGRSNCQIDNTSINQSGSEELLQKDFSGTIIGPDANKIVNDCFKKSQEKEKKKSFSPRKITRRKKLFSPKPKKKSNQGQRNSCNKGNSNDIHKKTKDSIDKKMSEGKSEREEPRSTNKDSEVQTETNKKNKLSPRGETNPTEITNRKRRNSRKNTGTEKDSEDDNASERNNDDDDDEVGGKRRKIKGKRVPNKLLRKSIEEKKTLNSSSDDDTQPEDKKEKDSKKSPPSKLKSPMKGRKPNKKSESKTGNENASKKKKEDNETNSKPPQGEKKKTAKSGGPNSRAFCGIDLNIDLNSTSRSVRQSSRLAQIKIKEQSDTKHTEEVHHKKDKSDKKSKRKKEEKEEKQRGKSKKKIKPKVVSEDDETEEPEKKKGRRKKKKKKFVFNEKDPWKSSSGDSSEGEDEEEDHFDEIVDEEDYVPVTVKSDHEFSPESDLENSDEIKPVRRARTAQKVTDSAEEKDVNESKDSDDFACEKCSKKDHPEWILLCDTCDHGWHASCLRPSLMLVPEGDWHCPPCQHTVLVKQLQETLKIYDRDQKRRENEELRKKRLAYVGISLDNVLPSGHQPRDKKEDESESESSESSRSESESEVEYSDEPVYQLRERRQGTTSYHFNEYDELINSAIRDEVEGTIGIAAASLTVPVESCPPPVKEEALKVVSEENSLQVNGESDKVIDTNKETEIKPKKKVKTGNGDEYSEDDDEEDDEEEEEFPSVVPKRNNVLPRPGKKKHRRLNCLDDPSDDDDGSDEDFRGSSSAGEDEEEEDDDSDDSDVRPGRSRRGNLLPVRRSSRTRRSRIDKEFINDDSDESDAPRRKKKKKLWTESDSESDDSTWGKRKKKKNYSSSGRRKIKKNKKYVLEDELSETETSKTPKKKRQRKIKYGGLDDLSVEELPSRRTRGRAINYQEVIESDSDEGVKKKRTSKRAVIEDDEDEFVAEKEDEKHDSESSSDEEEVDGEEISSDGEESSKEVKNQEQTKDKVANTEAIPRPTPHPTKVSPPKPLNQEIVPLRRGRTPKAMIAPPPERLVSEDEKYKAIVSKVSTLSHVDQVDINKTETNLLNPMNCSESFEGKIIGEPLLQVNPIKMDSSLGDSKFTHRNPPIKIRSGVPVNASGRRSPALSSPTNEGQFFPKSPSSGMVQSPPERPQYPLPLQRTLTPLQLQPSIRPVLSQLSSLKTEAFVNEDDGEDLNEEDLVDDMEEEDDDSEDDVLEEGEIPKKVARRMAREEERQQRLEEKRVADQLKTAKLPQNVTASLLQGSTGPPHPPTGILSEQKHIPTTQPSQPLLRVVSPLKLMANPPGPLQSNFMHSGMNPRMPMSSQPPARMMMPMRPPQSANMIPGMGMDESSSKRRGRGRGKKPPEQEKPIPEIMSGQSVIRGILQQPQSYPPTHYPQQYPPHPRIPFNPQRMPRPPFHSGPGQHLPLDPSPSGGGPVNVKPEPGNHPQSNPVHIPNKPPHSSAPPYHPPPHRFDSGIPRQPSYPPQGNPQLKHPQYGSYPPPPAPSGNYHFGSYPPPMTSREEPQVYPVQQQYNEQYPEQRTAPLATPPTNKGFSEEESSEFGGLVSYFSSQQEDNIDT